MNIYNVNEDLFDQIIKGALESFQNVRKLPFIISKMQQSVFLSKFC